MHRQLKEQNSNYPKRIDWKYNNKRYINAEFMHKWYLIKIKQEKMLTIKPGRFINEKCLRGRQ